MGLDLDIVKFKKSHFEKHVQVNGAQRFIGYSDGCDHKVELHYYRKYYDVKDAVVACLGNMNQTTFYELTETALKAIKKHSPLMEWDNPAHMDVFLTAIDDILESTDFETETIAFTWIS